MCVLLLIFMYLCCLQHIRMVLDLMTADRINLMVLSQQFADIRCLQEEKWFKTKYVVQGI